MGGGTASTSVLRVGARKASGKGSTPIVRRGQPRKAVAKLNKRATAFGRIRLVYRNINGGIAELHCLLGKSLEIELAQPCCFENSQASQNTPFRRLTVDVLAATDILGQVQ